MKQLKNERGLTLVELLAVIVILAIIAAIAAVAIGNVINNSKDKAILSDAVTIIDGVKIAEMDGALKEKEDTATGTITLESGDKTILEPYVELSEEKWQGFKGLKISGMNSGKTKYEITYTPLSKIKNEKYQPKNVTSTASTASLEDILQALEGKKPATANTQGEKQGA